MHHVSRFVSVLLVTTLAASCGGKDSSGGSSTPTSPTPSPAPSPTPSPAPAASTTFQGVIAGANGQTGTVTVAVQAQVARALPFLRLPFVATLHAQGASASGTVRVAGGGSTDVTGTYDSSSRALTLSGGGFALTGTFSSGALAGSYTGPGGAAGAFSSRSTASGTVTNYCGNIFSSGNASQATGVFNLVVAESAGAVSGAFYLNDAPFRNGPITGTVAAGALSLTYTDRVSGQSGTATGTIQGGSVSGSSPAASGGSNPFSGSTSRCQ